MLNNKPSEETIRKIVTEAVEIEKEFVCDSLPCALVGMNAGMMSDYIEYVADHLFASLGLAKEYNTRTRLIGWNSSLFKVRRTSSRSASANTKRRVS